MVIGIVGSRRRNTWKDYEIVTKEFFKWYVPRDSIVSGDCRKGAEHFAENIARKYHIPIRVYKANWDLYGKVAGFKRNTLIAQDAQILIACVASDRKGGTEDTIKKFEKLHPPRKAIIC
jgi:hypothetical protein